MFEIIDEMSELVYASDLNTYELLYINTASKKMFKLNDQVIGQKCYKVLQGLDSPCPFCNNHLLKETELYEWEVFNTHVNRHYLLKDKLIRWKNNALARVEIAFDITEMKKEKILLQNTLDSERVMINSIRDLYQCDNLSISIPNILERLGVFLGAERAYVFRIIDDKMYNTHEWCADGIAPQKQNLQGIGESLIDFWKPQFSKSECYIMNDINSEVQKDKPEYPILANQNIHSLVAAPLECDGRLVGYIGVDNPPKEKIDNITILFDTLRYFLSSSIRKSIYEKQLIRLSYRDQLTNAYNRNRYLEDVQKFLSIDTTIGVFYLDINGLKDINEENGTIFGDKIILAVAKNIASAFGNNNIYRIGGDEFIVLSGDVSEDKFNENIIELKRQFLINPICHVATGYLWKKTTKDIQATISIANQKMYSDKREYYRGTQLSNRYRHTSDDILGLGSERKIKEEIRDGNFLIYLQAKTSFLNRSLTGAEALIRYRSSTGEIIPPIHFLPLLEETHLIGLIDFYVFEQVCAKISEWSKMNKKIIPISINFSRHTITELNFIDKLSAIADKYKIEKENLEIEITESVAAMPGFSLNKFTTKMHQAGFLIAIDDFGVDYANLSLLTSMDFDKLKIDKSLILTLTENVKSKTLVQALATMCKSLELNTTVEGVETEEQFSLLREMDFGEAQGYLFSRPIPISEFEAKYFF